MAFLQSIQSEIEVPMIKQNIRTLEISDTDDTHAKKSIMVFADPENLYQWKALHRCTTAIDPIVVTLHPGEEIPSHRHDLSEEIALVIEGDGEIAQTTQRLPISKDELLFLEQGIPHLIRAGERGLTTFFLMLHQRMIENSTKCLVHLD